MKKPKIEEVKLEEEDIETPDGSSEWPSDIYRPEESSSGFTVTPLNSNESWVKTKWRPMIAWSYMAVCVFDFIIAPVLTMIFFDHTGGTYVQWKPLTLEGAGIYHMSMGAIAGVTAWSRGQEKIKGVE